MEENTEIPFWYVTHLIILNVNDNYSLDRFYTYQA